MQNFKILIKSSLSIISFMYHTFGFVSENGSPSVVSDCLWPRSLPGSSVHGILQARRLEWVAISFSMGVFPTQGSNPSLLNCRWKCWATWEAQMVTLRVQEKKLGNVPWRRFHNGKQWLLQRGKCPWGSRNSWDKVCLSHYERMRTEGEERVEDAGKVCIGVSPSVEGG